MNDQNSEENQSDDLNNNDYSNLEEIIELLKNNDQECGKYLEIDQFINATDDLQKSVEFLENLEDPFRWKWVSKSITSALYGYIICALGSSNYVNVSKVPKWLKKRFAKISDGKSNESYSVLHGEIFRLWANGKLKIYSFPESIDMLCRIRYFDNTGMKNGIEIDIETKEKVLNLRSQYRDQFEHFMPGHRAIRQEVFIPLVYSTNEVIKRVLGAFDLKVSYHEKLGLACELNTRIFDLLKRNKEYLVNKKTE